MNSWSGRRLSSQQKIIFDTIGDLVHDYNPDSVNKLGDGSQASVYQLTHVETGERVAVRIRRGDKYHRISPHVEYAYTADGHGFEHVVRSYNFSDDPVYLLMECGDDNLEDRLHAYGDSLPTDSRARILIDVAKGMQELHSLSLEQLKSYGLNEADVRKLRLRPDSVMLHRDIKPSNIILFDDPTNPANIVGKIGDPGLVGGSGSTMSEKGTNIYRAPETFPEKEKSPRWTVASDIYSLGITAYVTLSGNANPFSDTWDELERLRQEGDISEAEMTQRLLEQRRNFDYATLDWTGIEKWRPALLRALASDPAARYSSMQEFHDEFYAILTGGERAYDRALNTLLDTLQQASLAPVDWRRGAQALEDMEEQKAPGIDDPSDYRERFESRLQSEVQSLDEHFVEKVRELPKSVSSVDLVERGRQWRREYRQRLDPLLEVGADEPSGFKDVLSARYESTAKSIDAMFVERLLAVDMEVSDPSSIRRYGHEWRQQRFQQLKPLLDEGVEKPQGYDEHLAARYRSEHSLLTNHISQLNAIIAEAQSQFGKYTAVRKRLEEREEKRGFWSRIFGQIPEKKEIRRLQKENNAALQKATSQMSEVQRIIEWSEAWKEIGFDKTPA